MKQQTFFQYWRRTAWHEKAFDAFAVGVYITGQTVVIGMHMIRYKVPAAGRLADRLGRHFKP